ncbi:MAG: hypothetical protein KatS3mg010_0733 [Acidimicrobiia bacterium]|nr:MAG: hypothetical protein KatS3mg010_0733 [Acidimicrobiia bacterium]
MHTRENAPARRGSTFCSACSSSRPSARGPSGYSRASSSPISSLSEVSTPGSIPSSAARSTVFVRFPLWPSEKPASPTDR